MNFTIYRSKNTIEKRRKIYLSELHKNLTHEKEQVEIKQTKVEKSNTTKSYNSEDEITIAMCTQPHRKEQMLNVVKQLLPQCSRFCICFNNYDKIPEELPKSDKLICILAGGNNPVKDLGCLNKMYWCGDYDGYYATVDDDLDYPSNYIEELKKKVDFYNKKCVCSLHGRRFEVKNGLINTDKVESFAYYREHDKDELCHIVGMGVSMFVPKTLGLSKHVFLKYPKNSGDDEICSLWCQDRNVQQICISNKNVHVKPTDFAYNGLYTDKSGWNSRLNFLKGYRFWKQLNKDKLIRSKSNCILPVVITTHNRTRIAIECIKSLINNLKYDGKIQYIIADDRSKESHIPFLMETFQRYGINDVIVCKTNDLNYGLGASMNNGLNEAFKLSDFVLTTEDDWILQKELNITKYCNLIYENENVFGIRLACLFWTVTKNEEFDIIYENERFFTLKGSAFNNQVMLRHKRCYDKLGYYPVNVSSDESESFLRQKYDNYIKEHSVYENRILWSSEIKQNTYDDPNLYFIHIGVSTVGHKYDLPKRYMYLYDKHCRNDIRVLVLSAGTKNLKFQYDLTNENKRKYCQLHGYDFKFVNLDISDKESFHSRKQLLIDVINSKNYDWVMWMDCDAWFNNFNISIQDIINNYADKNTSLILSRDQGMLDGVIHWHDCYINSGILLFKCDDVSKQIIDRWDNPSEHSRIWMQKKTGLNDQPYLSILMLWDKYVMDHTKIVFPLILNTFAKYGFNEYNYILHVPGFKEIENRHQYLPEFMKYYNQSQKEV